MCVCARGEADDHDEDQGDEEFELNSEMETGSESEMERVVDQEGGAQDAPGCKNGHRNERTCEAEAGEVGACTENTLSTGDQFEWASDGEPRGPDDKWEREGRDQAAPPLSSSIPNFQCQREISQQLLTSYKVPQATPPGTQGSTSEPELDIDVSAILNNRMRTVTIELKKKNKTKNEYNCCMPYDYSLS